MSVSDGSLQQDDRHHRRSRFPSPVSPGCAGETPAEQEERQLAEAALPVRLPAGQPQAAPDDPEPPAPNQCRPGRPPPLPRSLTLPPCPQVVPRARGQTGLMGPQPLLKPDTPQPPVRHWRAGPALRGPRVLRRAGHQGLPRPQRRAGRAPSTASAPGHATPTCTPQKPSPPKAALPEERPRPVCAPVPKRTPMDMMLPQLQRRVVQAGQEGTGGQGGHGGGRGGNDDRKGRGAKRGGTGLGTEGNRGKVGRRQRRRAGTRDGQRHGQQRGGGQA